jgi:hypothetical protein
MFCELVLSLWMTSPSTVVVVALPVTMLATLKKLPVLTMVTTFLKSTHILPFSTGWQNLRKSRIVVAGPAATAPLAFMPVKTIPQSKAAKNDFLLIDFLSSCGATAIGRRKNFKRLG